MQGKLFSLHKRSLKKGHVYYVQFKNEDGSYGTAKSTGQRTKGAAETWAINYLRSGQVVTKENVRFQAFADGFFAEDSEYVREKRLRGYTIGKRQLDNQAAYVSKYLNAFFGPMRLSRISSADDAKFQRILVDRGLSGSLINHATSALKIILSSALKKKLIQALPIIERVADRPAERGILTADEVKRVFAVEWTDYRAYVANLVAATTGLRLGEILALRHCTVLDGVLDIRNSWDTENLELKDTKNGRSRFVPIPPKAQEALSVLRGYNPFKDPEDFVFYCEERGRAMNKKIPTDTLYKALESIGVSKDERKSRGIVFHSWRHWFNSLLVNGRIPPQKVRVLTGHATDQMTHRYYHSDEFADVAEIQRGIV